ncbi:MAG TPA: hypothetical protein VGG46_04050 [Terriglobales bacterium]
MPLNESTQKTRNERHPLQFDLLGVPRNGRVRDTLLKVVKETEMQPTNSFAADKSAGVQNLNNMNLSPEQQNMLKNLLDSFISGGQGKEFDLSKPPVNRYRNNPFPRMVYHHQTGHVVTVHDDRQLQLAEKKGFQKEPSLNHDYSQVKNGIAAVKMAAATRPETITVNDLEDEELLAQQSEAEAAATAQTDETLAGFADANDAAPESQDAEQESRPRRRR